MNSYTRLLESYQLLLAIMIKCMDMHKRFGVM